MAKPTVWTVAVLIAVAGLTLPASVPAQQRDAAAVAADDYVAEAMPVDEARLSGIRAGQVLPPCSPAYPNLETTIGGKLNAPSADRATRIYHAIDGAILKQNLVALGIDDARATDYADRYVRERGEYDAMAAAWQAQYRAQGNTPADRVIKRINAAHEPGVPVLQAGAHCAQFSHLTRITPYRFVLDPAAAQLFILPRFAFRLCAIEAADPYDRARCDGWLEVLEGQDAKMLGSYAYSAEWSDGRVRREFIDLPYVDSAVHALTLRPRR